MFFFKKKETFNRHFVSVVSTAVAVAFLWKGVWTLSENFLFPDNSALDALVSTFLGLVMLYLVDKNRAK